MLNATLTTYRLHDHSPITGEKPDNYILRVKDLPEPDKPREKLLQLGAGELSLAELLAVVLGVGTKKEEVMSMAQRVLKEYGETAISSQSNPTRLAEALDIPIVKACQIIASLEIGRRFYATKAGKPVFVRNAEQAFQYCQGMAYSQKEQLRGLYLNSRYELIHDEVISVGSLTANIVHPREVFAPAISRGAVAVIVAHNHPSDNPEPTAADYEVTAQLKAAGLILGIELLDHLVITTDKYISIKENTHDN